jgi:hypothetical protein
MISEEFCDLGPGALRWNATRKRELEHMAKNIKKIADGLGATVVGQVLDTGGGAFGAARLARLVEEARVLEGIRRGLEDVKAGRSQPVAEAFADIRRELDLPR